MKWTTLAAMVIVASANVADAGLFGGHGHGKKDYGCCAPAPSCCAPSAACCAPAAECVAPGPACCAPQAACAPGCAAPEACCDAGACDACAPGHHGHKRHGLMHRMRCRWNDRRAKRDCCAPAPSCCAPTCAAPCGDACTY
jgi:hypothetical protein